MLCTVLAARTVDQRRQAHHTLEPVDLPEEGQLLFELGGGHGVGFVEAGMIQSIGSILCAKDIRPGKTDCGSGATEANLSNPGERATVRVVARRYFSG